VQFDVDFLQVEYDVRDVFRDARQRRELVLHALDFDRGDRRTLQRRQQYAPERIANGRAVATLERLADELAVGRRQALGVDFQPRRLD
jgi:hypothetical protein